MAGRPTPDELNALTSRAGFDTVRDGEMDGLKGAHIGQPGGEYHIYHRRDLWEGSKAQIVLHEVYEIILENLAEMHSSGPPDLKVCRLAERFAAAVLTQPDIFAAYAEASGLDVVALRDVFGCAYASVVIRLAKVVRDRPLMVVLYEWEERGEPTGWTEPAVLRAKVVRRTAGFAAPRSPLLNGWRGGIPRKDKPLSDGSLAERAAHSGRPEYAEEDGLAVVITPVYWKGCLAKVIVVTVPWEH